MTSHTAASRYARALFDVALKEEADLSEVASQLGEFDALVRGHATLEQVLLNPAVPSPRKRAIVGQLVARAQVKGLLGKLLVLLAERDRLALLSDIIAAYRVRVLDYQRVVRAEVTTALPLAPDHAGLIERALAETTGRTVVLSTRVDPAIIGGMVARVGSVVYDGSVSRHLEKMKDRLSETTGRTG